MSEKQDVGGNLRHLVRGGPKPPQGGGGDEAAIAALFNSDGSFGEPPVTDDFPPPGEAAMGAADEHETSIPRNEARAPAPVSAPEVVVAAATATAAAAPAAAPLARIPRKVLIGGFVTLLLVTVVMARGCLSEPSKPESASAKSAPTPVVPAWTSLEVKGTRPLTEVPVLPALSAGVERERNLGKELDSVLKPPEAPKEALTQVDQERLKSLQTIKDLETKLAEASQRLEEQKKQNEALKKQAGAKKPATVRKPTVRVMAIAKTERCRSCPLLALLDVDGSVQQVAPGDKLAGYVVAIEPDRVLLTKNRETLTFYSAVVQ